MSMGFIFKARFVLKSCALLSQPLLNHLFKLGNRDKRRMAIASSMLGTFPIPRLRPFY